MRHEDDARRRRQALPCGRTQSQTGSVEATPFWAAAVLAPAFKVGGVLSGMPCGAAV